jgi:hypothetical protein
VENLGFLEKLGYWVLNNLHIGLLVFQKTSILGFLEKNLGNVFQWVLFGLGHCDNWFFEN